MQPGPLSDEQLRSLAKEVRDGVTDTETDWLEWKRGLDLTAPEERFKASKQILGMANRVPGLARRNCGGCGYVLLGVEQGALRGTDWLDPAQLHDWIDPYIGATGPAWQPRYIDVDNTTILVLEVEPPRPGDSIHSLKKPYGSFDAGAIFVRKNGKTHPAAPGDIENLEQRARGTQLDLDLDLDRGSPISWFDQSALIAAIMQLGDREREAQLRRAGHTQEPDSVASANFQISRTMTRALYWPDDRSIEQYADEVAQWHTEWKERAPERWLGAYAAAGHGMCSLSLTNLTDHNFTSVEVRLEIPRARVITDLNEIESDLPRLPRPFGQGRIPGFDSFDMSPVLLERPGFLPTVWVDNDDDGASVTWDVGHVRPEETLHMSDPLYILVSEAPSKRQLSIDWSATSRSVSGVARGVLELPLSDEPVLLDDIDHDLASSLEMRGGESRRG